MFKLMNSGSDGRFCFKGHKQGFIFCSDLSVFLLLQTSHYLVHSSLKGFTGMMSSGLGLAETDSLEHETISETYRIPVVCIQKHLLAAHEAVLLLQ